MKTVLVLAQHPELVEAVRAALNGELFRIVHRIEIEEAEPFLQPGAIDLAVVDVEFSQVQGLWVVEKLRRRLPQVGLVVFTGAGPWEWEEEAYLHGVAHVLAKPLRARMFAALMDRLVSAAPKPAARPAPPRRPPAPESRPAGDAGRGPIRALEVLRDFSGILTHSLCAEAMLKQFLLLLREILGINRAAIFLRNPVAPFSKSVPDDGRRFRSACAIGLSSGLLEHFELSFEAGLGGFLFQQGRILRRDSAEALEDDQMQKEFELLGAEVAVPILDRETLIGVAVFDGRVTGEALGNAELELIFHLLEQLGLAVRNIWLHDQLSGNHEMMSEILRELSSACVVVSRELAILHCNKTAKQYFARRGRRNAEMEFSDLPPVLGSKVYQVLKTGTGIGMFRYQPAESPQTIYQVNIVPFQRPGSTLPNSALLVVEDHTLSEQLKRLEMEAGNLRLVKTMAERFAHEIGNALVPLSTHQQLLGAKFRDPEFRASLDSALADSVKRIGRLTTQMRYLARDALNLQESFPLAALIDDAIAEAQQHQTAKSPQIVIDTGAVPLVLTGERAALKHALAELFLNALQGNPVEPKVNVRVQLEPGGPSDRVGNGGTGAKSPGDAVRAVRIEIVDNGPGFTPEAIKRVPEPFFTTRNVGLGLGMTVSKRIIETHRGKLAIVAPPGVTSGFVRVSLPLETVTAKEKPPGGRESRS